ncbi:ATP-dependent RNA helicase HrpB [Planctomycetes bacterium Poly30]|uniref:ATP-dependent RNA helicase HrpB n=1 Tax=Saltatorellus ferox TaxID=2528018 RepID=A0A518EPW7_9BACT|nr:ATP-dependent RNA helicase HrpB [Planctomycetes bacterium Poly30]
MSSLERLPIDDLLPEIVSAMLPASTAGTSGGGVAVLVAAPGAGKTTRVPPALEAAGLGPIVVLEPRRIAARAAARRVAEEQGWRVGEEVGYHVRFDRKCGPKTRVLFCTEGILLARLQADPFLEGVGCLVFDEFHERSLDADLALAMARRVRADVRPDLGILVTSATLDPDPVSRFLGGAPVLTSEGRSYPIDQRFLPPIAAAAGSFTGSGRSESLEDQVARGVNMALAETDGDVLVFLAGVGEIQRCAERLARIPKIEVHQLYGDLDPAAQDAALRAGPKRRVVLATNVAESSVTVGGVRAVVDSGEARVLRHDAGSGVDRLVVERIDRAAADQRAGRAGRLGPGLCVRLWSQIDDRTLDPFLVPEVRRLDVAAPVLELANWGETDVSAFPWFERPRPGAIEGAVELLRGLGALDRRGHITEKGRAMSRLPLPPRLAALVLAGAELGALEIAALAAALLSERDPFRRPGGGGPPGASRRDATESDVFERCVALDGGPSGRHLDVSRQAARQVQRVRDQILRSVKEPKGQRARSDETALAKALFAAFPDRLCVRRRDDRERAVMAGGKGLRMGFECGVTEAEFFVAVRLMSGRRPGEEDIVVMASAVDRSWIDGGEVRVSRRPVFDAARGRVVGRRREMLGPLVLSEADHPDCPSAEAEEVLVEAAQKDPSRALGLDRPEVASVLERLRFLRAHVPDVGLPDPSEEAFRELIPQIAGGARSFADLTRRPVLDLFLGSLTHQQRVALEREAPERLTVPSGSHIRLAYDGERPPVLAVRIQEMFGLAETPRVASGRVPVLLHLLAPNGRPQQVTGDLASFWKDAYHHVRKDLRSRYPKHPWPEDPLTAPPTARARRRRR